MTTQTIARETDGTAKGFTLQKLRASSLVLQYFQDDTATDFLAAVEYGGDIYIDGFQGKDLYIEEDKLYDSKDFSFVSPEVQNTLVYFLDYWLNNNRDARIKFGFYATNGIKDERDAGRAKTLAVTFPDVPILGILQKEDLAYPDLLPAIKTLLTNEYHRQYSNYRKFNLANSHYGEIQQMSNDDWRSFLSRIHWQFNQESIEELEQRILNQIKATTNVGAIVPGTEPYIRAALFYQLDTRHAKQIPAERFLDKAEVELIFRRISQGIIDYNSLKYLNLDYTALQTKTSHWLANYIHKKYHIITSRPTPPVLRRREIALFDPVLRSRGYQTEAQPDYEKQLRLQLGDQIPFARPIFLYGELGSGKSTLVADYMRELISQHPSVLPIFIPSSYLLGKSLHTIQEVTTAVDAYVNEEMAFPEKLFRLDHVLNIPRDLMLVVDGVDELDRVEAQDLISTLKQLKDHHSSLRIIATGRPLELEGLLSPDWLAYAMIPLTLSDIQAIFVSEGISDGLSPQDATTQATQKIALLKTRPDLLSVTTTPLVACAIYLELDQATPTKTLGDIVYAIFKRRLDWHLKDAKHNDYKAFLTAYTSITARQRLIAPLALDIYQSKTKSLHESKILDRLTQLVPDRTEKAQIVTEAFSYFEQTLLQRTTNGHLGFMSQPLLECAAGVALADLLTPADPRSVAAPMPPAVSLDHWRPLSFAMSVLRERGDEEDIRPKMSGLFQTAIIWPYTNIAQAAVVIAELKDTFLAVDLINKIKELAFRPLREINSEDHLSASSFAFCISLSGDIGFDWFMQEYLDGRRPLNNFEDRLVAKVLGYLILQSNSKLAPTWIQRLNELLTLNKHFVTSFCHTGFSILALLPTIRFSAGERSLLLAELLNDDIFGVGAEAALRTLKQEPGATTEILNALETVSSRTHFSQTIETSLLWFEFHDGRPLSLSILRNCLSAATKELFPTIFGHLTATIPEADLRSYLRFLVLSEDKKSAGDAALFLLWAGDTDTELLAPVLSDAIDWLTHRYGATDDIAAFFKAQPFDLAIVLSVVMPTDNHLGVQPSFWQLYLQALQVSPSLHMPGFSKLLTTMSFHVLTRYPAIRMALVALLNTRPEYKDLLLEQSAGLSLVKAHHANAILVACFPRESVASLISLIKGSFAHHSDQDEWERFLLGLDFSQQVKQELHAQLPSFVERSKIFALSILHFQSYPLDQGEIDTLATGLLAGMYHFESMYSSTENTVRLLSEPSMTSFLLTNLANPNKHISRRAANTLLSFHKNGLTEEQLAILYSLQCEEHESSFYHMQIQEPDLMTSQTFKTAVETVSADHPSLLSLFFKGLGNVDRWETFFKQAINQGRRFHQHHFPELFNWMISSLRLFSHQRSDMASAVGRLLDIPGYREHASIYGQLLLFADELGLDVRSRILDKTDEWYSDADEEVNLAITVRSGLDFTTIPSGPHQGHYIIFARYQADSLNLIPQDLLDKLVSDTPYLSQQLIPSIGRILLYGQLIEQERESMAQKSTAGVVLNTVVGYCRREDFSIETLLETIEKDFFERKNGPEEPVYVGMIEKIAAYKAQKEAGRPAYLAALRRLLGTDNQYYYKSFIIKLFEAGEQPTIREVAKMLNFLLQWDGIIDMQSVWHLSRYFAECVPPGDKTELLETIERVLGAIAIHFEERRLNDYLLASWILSLAAIHLSGAVSPVSKRGFLLGLQSLFVATVTNNFGYLGSSKGVVFPGKDLLQLSEELFEKIPLAALRELYEAGAQSNIPEVRTISRMLNALAGNRPRS